MEVFESAWVRRGCCSKRVGCGGAGRTGGREMSGEVESAKQRKAFVLRLLTTKTWYHEDYGLSRSRCGGWEERRRKDNAEARRSQRYAEVAEMGLALFGAGIQVGCR